MKANNEPSNANTSTQIQTEQDLAKMWKTILQVDNVAPHDNFFDLGGDSSTMMVILQEIKSKFNVSLTIRAIFESQTIHELAKRIENEKKSLVA